MLEIIRHKRQARALIWLLAADAKHRNGGKGKVPASVEVGKGSAQEYWVYLTPALTRLLPGEDPAVTLYVKSVELLAVTLAAINKEFAISEKGAAK